MTVIVSEYMEFYIEPENNKAPTVYMQTPAEVGEMVAQLLRSGYQKVVVCRSSKAEHLKAKDIADKINAKYEEKKL